MNCPSRVDPEALPNGWNQNPASFALQTNNEFNGVSNLTHQRDHIIPLELPQRNSQDPAGLVEKPHQDAAIETSDDAEKANEKSDSLHCKSNLPSNRKCRHDQPKAVNGQTPPLKSRLRQAYTVLREFGKFVGPGFMVAVAYIDPGS